MDTLGTGLRLPDGVIRATSERLGGSVRSTVYADTISCLLHHSPAIGLVRGVACLVACLSRACPRRLLGRLGGRRAGHWGCWSLHSSQALCLDLDSTLISRLGPPVQTQHPEPSGLGHCHPAPAWRSDRPPAREPCIRVLTKQVLAVKTKRLLDMPGEDPRGHRGDRIHVTLPLRLSICHPRRSSRQKVHNLASSVTPRPPLAKDELQSGEGARGPT